MSNLERIKRLRKTHAKLLARLKEVRGNKNIDQWEKRGRTAVIRKELEVISEEIKEYYGKDELELCNALFEEELNNE